MTDSHNASSAGSADDVNYAEILRLHRRYRISGDEPLWKVFVRVGQTLETAERHDAGISVSRERAAREQQERHRSRAIDDCSDWPKDGFINDYD